MAISPMFSTRQRDFPEIIGTGFLLSPLGVVCTCRHVVDTFDRLPKPAEYKGIPALAAVFRVDEATGHWGFAAVDILGVGHGVVTGDMTAYAGPQPPEVAYLLLNAIETPCLRLADPPVLEGEPIGIGGFPMGTDLLKAPGWLHQITPTLFQGIVSAILPHHRHPTPHGLLLHAQTLGGSSGSPVFRSDGSVVGMVYGGVTQPTDMFSLKDGGSVGLGTTQPTSLALCVSRDLIAGTLPGAERDAESRSGRPTLADRLEKATRRERKLGEAILDRWPGSEIM